MGMTGKISRFLAIAAVVVGFVPALAQAQGTTISGQVTGIGGAPIVGASVSIPTLRVGAFTDDAGRYSFGVPESANGTTVTVAARRLGFPAELGDGNARRPRRLRTSASPPPPRSFRASL